MILCYLGCGQEGKIQRKSGKFSCEPSSNSCPAVRRKNSISVTNAHSENLIPGWNKLRSVYGLTPYNKGVYKINHKKRLLLERGHQCQKCNNSFWNEIPITIELEHIDGDVTNNKDDNLLLLCPNCHSQTKTWRRKKSKNKGPKHSEEEMISVIKSSHCLNDCLKKLNLKWGSGNTILKVMEKNKITFMDS